MAKKPTTSAADLRQEALATALTTIERKFGKGSIMRMDDGAALTAIPVIPTGSIGLDIALGVGGIPKGRVTEIYGPESSGKTTLALHAWSRSAQKKGGIAAFIDAEHALDRGLCQKPRASTSMSFGSSPSPTTVSRPWR